MSSIDKYVVSEAHEYSPNVDVRTEYGRIVGYIGNKKIFDIADRYGYLNEKERTIIRESIQAYEKEDEEQKRRIAVQLENQRKAVYRRLVTKIQGSRHSLDTSYHSAKRSHASVADSMDLSDRLSRLNNFNLREYKIRIDALELRVEQYGKDIERDYAALKSQLDRFENGIDASAETDVLLQKIEELARIRTSLTGALLPVNEINQLRSELDQIELALNKVSDIAEKLREIHSDGLAGRIAANALRAIEGQSISSLRDVDVLVNKVQESLAEINNIEFRERADARSDEIALLNGIVKSCAPIREHIKEYYYEAKSYKNEISEAADRVVKIYSDLQSADYTTCSEDRILQVMEVVQDITINARTDAGALETLRILINEGEVYNRDDRLQEDNYRVYKENVDELLSRGVRIDEIESFDPFHPEEQSRRFNERLLRQDVYDAISRTKMTYVKACRVMEDMGYKMLYYNMGGDQESDDALACEAVYVIPGCEGVVFKLIVSDCEISRRIVGIQRPSGRTTSVERVMEVASYVERDGEMMEFLNRYADANGEPPVTTYAVDTDTDGAEQFIAENGCFVVSKDHEKWFDRLVAEGSDSQRARWKTHVAQSSSFIPASTKKVDDDRQSASDRRYNVVKHAREQKHADRKSNRRR